MSPPFDGRLVGPEGPQGPQGNAGDAGPPGPRGPKGDAGRDGIEGKRGPRGARGKPGPAGPEGPQGVAGAPGPEGEPGYDGVGMADVYFDQEDLVVELTDGRRVRHKVVGRDGASGVVYMGGGRPPQPTIAAFTAQVDQAVGVVCTSNAAAVSGDADTVWAVMVRGDGSPQIDVNADGVWAKERFVRAGDTIRQRHTSSASTETATVSTIYYQGGSSAFSVTTVAYIFHPLALTFEANVIAAGGTVSEERLVMLSDRLYEMDDAGLDADRFDRLWVIAAENAVQSSVCLISGERFTPVNGPTFTTDRGYAGGSGPKYLRLGYTPSVDAVAFQETDGHYAHHVRGGVTSGSAQFGSVPTGDFSAGLNTFVANGVYLRLNDDPETGEDSDDADMVGFVAANRSGDTRAGYRNGGAFNVSAYVGSSPSRSLRSEELALGASGSWTTEAEWSFFSIGGSLTAEEHADLATIWTGHLTDIGAA